MSSKAVSFRLEESLIKEIKYIGEIYHESITSFVREALKKAVEEKKNDFYYRLTANTPVASQEETDEIVTMLKSMSDEDREIAYIEEVEIL